MSEIVTVRLDKETKQKAKRYKLNMSQVAREALKREIAERERQELLDNLRAMSRILQKIPRRNIVRAVRESRDQR